MRPIMLATASAALMLSACHASVDVGKDAREQGDNVHIAMNGDTDKDHVTLDVPGFSAKMSLPDLHLSDHMDLDGIKVAPDTKVKVFDVVSQSKDQTDSDKIRMQFTNPGTPAAMIDYYKRAATGAGYADIAATATGVSATKKGKQFALSIEPDGAGSRGTITMRGE